MNCVIRFRIVLFPLPLLVSLKVDNSSRKGRKGDADEAPPDGAVFDQWEAANTGGLGGPGSISRQKVLTHPKFLTISCAGSVVGVSRQCPCVVLAVYLSLIHI